MLLQEEISCNKKGFFTIISHWGFVKLFLTSKNYYHKLLSLLMSEVLSPKDRPIKASKQTRGEF